MNLHLRMENRGPLHTSTKKKINLIEKKTVDDNDTFKQLPYEYVTLS